MNVQEIRGRIEQSGFIAILRGNYAGWFSRIAEALINAGATAMEVTFNSPHAAEGIQEVRQKFGDAILMGAGTVLNVHTAQIALDAGAQFIVAPNTNPEVIRFCVERNVCVVPGAYTATEVMLACEAGATLVKLFPADLTYFKNLRGPLSHVPFVPTGGVELSNAAEFIRLGAVAVGMGSAIIGEYIKHGDGLKTMHERAAALIRSIQLARTER
ncbi:MAG: bifunctional 4-hydroxy-2-oxoglutarate aldolase/2-dehydro-3-deoxy-phosphogluconate aldolase [Anaerolineae bacterium]|nr:bifunctional 4-hydroxy-2-oxoglutarate aldolase/2-dehydro-3-deoxy-phosphogluconate aldolase [Thermoflexales bacterium]MDW8408355.1 bifunctional 4-hydroxy-2-oxoglutarate aldolase/2-dehydro-3-deoxy-phosphogluconate aldolase [Anaerolineae bacterium]